MTRPARPIKLGLVQMQCSTDPDDNLRRALTFLRKAASEGCRVACLPELFRSQYFCQTEDHANFDLAEPIPGPSTEALAAVARET
ncbi:MAG TPA: nitrilase-related carbon-nitrogen hydrolase, partial [Isosphaeraceae bacterium]